jgi:DNA-binding CsgD family transcriptional regulator
MTNDQPVVLVPEFVGRGDELAALTRALAGGSAVVLIEGEAGIGKSRLLAEYLATTDERILVADCPPFRQPQTLGPVTDAIREAADTVRGLPLSALAGCLRPMFPEWATELPGAPEPAEDASAARHRLFRALAELLAALEVRVLVVEDAHWADEATLEFLLFLAFRQPRRASLIVTYRPDDVPAGSLLPRLTSRLPAAATQLRLTLGLLDTKATAELVSSMLSGEHVSDQFAAFVHEHTEGMPLAIEETIRLMADRSDLTRRRGGWVRRHVDEIAVPASIRDAVLERAGRLDAGARSVLRAAAVLTDPADEATLAAVSRLSGDELVAGLSAALTSGLLRTSQRGLVSFRHVLAARATYDAIPGPERRAMHRRAGLALEDAPGALAALARHFREAGETVKWCGYAERAASLAVESGDETTALALLDDMLTGAGRPGWDTCLGILEKLSFGTLTEPVRQLQALSGTLQAVIAQPGLTPHEDARWRLQRARVLGTLDELGTARAEIERAIPGLGDDPVLASQAMTELGWPFDTTTPAAVHLEWLERAARVAENASLPPVTRLRNLVQRISCLLQLGQDSAWDEFAGLPAAAASPAERIVITLGHQNAAHLASIWGRYDDAAAWLRSALKLAREHNLHRHAGNTEMTQAHLDWFTGAWDGLAARVRALADEVLIQPAAYLEADLISGLLAAAAGDRAEAERRLRSVIAAELRRDAPAHAIEPAGVLARLLLNDRRPAEALAVTGDIARIVALKNFWVLAADFAPAHTAALIGNGRGTEAARFTDAFAVGMTGCGGPAANAAVITCRALLAETGEGDSAGLFDAAARAWEALPRPYEALLARERQARCLFAAGEAGNARAVLADVLRGLSGLGATADAERVARGLRDSGVQTRRPGAGRPGYGDKLSPRELDVVRLVADGQTNRQIAESLFLSPKTVARHVDASMRKLNVSSRTALAVAAVTAGIVTTPASLFIG